jgi:hypothetical protein
VERFGRWQRVLGGVGMAAQAQKLRDGREVIVAPPGRLVDHLDRGDGRLDGIEILVRVELRAFFPSREAIVRASSCRVCWGS